MSAWSGHCAPEASISHPHVKLAGAAGKAGASLLLKSTVIHYFLMKPKASPATEICSLFFSSDILSTISFFFLRPALPSSSVPSSCPPLTPPAACNRAPSCVLLQRPGHGVGKLGALRERRHGASGDAPAVGARLCHGLPDLGLGLPGGGRPGGGRARSAQAEARRSARRPRPQPWSRAGTRPPARAPAGPALRALLAQL